MNFLKKRLLPALLSLLPTAAVALLAVWLALSSANIGELGDSAELTRLSEALRRSAVACYAAEGRYPPTIDYITEHYGIVIDRDKYSVFYEIFAENLMPEITVIPKSGS